MQLFEYAVYKDEKRDRDDEVVDAAAILIEPDYMLAKDIAEVNLKLSRMIPEAEVENADRISIVVRPF